LEVRTGALSKKAASYNGARASVSIVWTQMRKTNRMGRKQMVRGRRTSVSVRLHRDRECLFVDEIAKIGMDLISSEHGLE
jgi:hypothetical protein